MRKILQAFKKLFKRKSKAQVYYICDPVKATHCSKDGCWDLYKGPCKCTSKKKCAKLDANGSPIIANDEDICNVEWLEHQIM